MYAWKCWRETRTRFFLLLVLAIGLPSWVIFLAMFSVTNGQILQLRHFGQKEIDLFVGGIRDVIIGMSGVISLGTGVLLGATSVGQEFEKETLEYLWTRPRLRNSFTWTHWLVCLAELVVILSATPLLAAFVFALIQGSLGENRVLLLVPVMSTLGGMFYLGLTILTTAWRRSGSSGLVFSVGIVSIYGIISEAAVYYLHIPGIVWPNAPLTGWQYALTHLRVQAFPWSGVLPIAVLAIAFVFFAQFGLQQAEV
jgi:ABC-2 family transporter protein